jgi:hypothetical protein
MTGCDFSRLPVGSVAHCEEGLPSFVSPPVRQRPASAGDRLRLSDVGAIHAQAESAHYPSILI